MHLLDGLSFVEIYEATLQEVTRNDAVCFKHADQLVCLTIVQSCFIRNFFNCYTSIFAYFQKYVPHLRNTIFRERVLVDSFQIGNIITTVASSPMLYSQFLEEVCC